MNDKLFDLCRPRSRPRPRDKTGLLTPNPDSAQWVVEQWRKRVDGELLGSAAATEAISHSDADGLSWAKLEQTVNALLASVTPRDQAMQRLAERLKREPTIRYISDEWIPDGSADEEFFWWEEYDVLLIAAAQLEAAKRQFEQLGITLIEVDEAWWKEMAQADWDRWGLRR